MSRKPKSRITLYITYGIVVLMLISTVTLSRYLAVITGSGTAKTASIALDGNLPVDISGMCPGESKTLLFTVTNTQNSKVSDVDQEYYIMINSTGNLPLTFNLDTEDAVITDHALSPGAAANVWTGGLLPCKTEKVHEYSLTVSWPEDNKNPVYMKEVDAIMLTVNTQQN